MNGFGALMKEIPGAPSHQWAHSKKTVVYGSGNGPSPDTESAANFISDFPASSSIRNPFLLFTRHSVCGTLLRQPKPNRPPMAEWINNMWDMRTIENDSDLTRPKVLTCHTCYNIEDIMQSERNQLPKDKYCRMPLIWGT